MYVLSRIQQKKIKYYRWFVNHHLLVELTFLYSRTIGRVKESHILQMAFRKGKRIEHQTTPLFLRQNSAFETEQPLENRIHLGWEEQNRSANHLRTLLRPKTSAACLDPCPRLRYHCEAHRNHIACSDSTLWIVDKNQSIRQLYRHTQCDKSFRRRKCV